MSFETKRFVAGGLLGLGVITGGVVMAHEALSVDSDNARIAGCLDQAQAAKPVCHDVALTIIPQEDQKIKNSAEVVMNDAEFVTLGGLGMAAAGVVGLGYMAYKTFRD
jgi:hypothetical protein